MNGIWYREDNSNLDQRVEGLQVHLSALWPISRSVPPVGSIGYENDCLSGTLGPYRFSALQASEISANYSYSFGCSSANGSVDENCWMEAYFTPGPNQQSSRKTDIYRIWLDAGGPFGDTSKTYGTTTAYCCDLSAKLSARAGVASRKPPRLIRWRNTGRHRPLPGCAKTSN